MQPELVNQIEVKLRKIYQTAYQPAYLEKMLACTENYSNNTRGSIDTISEKNVYLIAYGDSIFEKNKHPLQTLNEFLQEYAQDVITDVHLLPIFPSTSDDGFSVTDYKQIDEQLGDWDDVQKMSENFRVMLDFVANHMSKSSDWFKRFSDNEAPYNQFFIEKDSKFDYKNVTRPRTSPLFHKYENGKELWTTFSEDQLDLNVRNIDCLVALTDVLLFYASKQSTSIRLDAIGFLWKTSGTTCMHLPETHEIISLWRLLIDELYPNLQIITETNVPHEENISYFGDGENEANMVYQFPLPPLVLHTFTCHDATKLSTWAKSISQVSSTTTYFNFLASHDGIGMRPATGILSDEEINSLVQKAVQNGGQVSYKDNADGTQSVYELNINYGEALQNPGEDTTEELVTKKIIAAHSILLTLQGVPAIYYHSLLGSKNDLIGYEKSGIKRRINREKLEKNQLARELESVSYRQTIFTSLKKLVQIRRNHTAFSPFATQEILDLGADVFAIKRESDTECIYGIINVTSQDIRKTIAFSGTNLLTNQLVTSELELAAYEVVWIKKADQ
ncbi:sugar phosphorylase [Listeria cossartiae subsp. cayugensis]|uniref:Sucrose phosphorylase n=1 Tax=Listeria cossartiae subsp. cayugensis TaxID=2713505 RepID=A0ABU2IQ43_9LIST|nr:sugar phosphorylase [Listeria cossartiae]MDT0003965.1 sugar phosphorylase [Listeria cossartiae subsp. cayugensis]MDT0020359.1 sugar phosphorylase [Listeria cossartiae subsp. cayugensis]MDT0036426.1 sugar phosphorylase [Listeria cossartiae subsp. cayugensis]MDT0042110.1 sugar phosphorylase [Listeria cossartiae subsp. cayugensis]MDT0047461.1 sugar phosphorylase [Listeria cossartiae subsp. cayugensis]